MHLLYEEGGDIRVATVLSSSGSGETRSWQVSALSGKHLKLKAKEVWLEFDNPDARKVHRN
jgi:exoribonuclease-2